MLILKLSLRKLIIFCSIYLFGFQLVSAQKDAYQWFDPVTESAFQFQGQGWQHQVLASPYHRFPAKAEQTVRKAVWNLSNHNAGITVTFATDADEIKIIYGVTSRLAMPHMPATGVSGVDLYVNKEATDSPVWCKPQYKHGDTLTYTYTALNSFDPTSKVKYYSLSLPLYNSVKWMKIGLSKDAQLESSPLLSQKPIVVYGTSIAQGGCASRPGMAWTNIVQRQLQHPVLNLAFSGNGRLEPEVVDLITEIDAAVFVLDCLPNLTSAENYPDEILRGKIKTTVERLRQDHPHTPILLTQHAGYSDDQVNTLRYKAVFRVNKILEEMFDTLQREGVSKLYFLSKNDIDMCMDCTVDGTHQTDLGMQYYGDAYSKILQKILQD